jgi:hypothetical protein
VPVNKGSFSPITSSLRSLKVLTDKSTWSLCPVVSGAFQNPSFSFSNKNPHFWADTSKHVSADISVFRWQLYTDILTKSLGMAKQELFFIAPIFYYGGENAILIFFV